MGRTATLAAASLCALSCSSHDAQPAPTPASTVNASPPIEAVLFAYGAADGHIWIVDGSTGVRTQITHGDGGVDFDPHWSPDGQQLVFRTERVHPPDPTGTGYDGIFVIRVDGTDEHAVNPAGGGLFPAWSPDGATIMFSSPRPDGREGLFTVRPDGTGLRDLATYGEHVGWSPDGRQLLVDRNASSGTQNWDIWIGAADATNLRQLTTATGDDHFAAWSPDGARVLFTTQRNGDDEVWVMNADGTGQQPVIGRPGTQSGEGWLPDGRILFADHPAAGDGVRWYVANPDGTDEHTLPYLDDIEGPLDWRRK